MSRLPLLTLGAAALLALAPAAAALPTNAHFDPTKFPKACSPCHKGHGAPGTPRLTGGTKEFCLKCHESAAKDVARRLELGLGAAASPADVRTEFLKAVSHDRATCFDCHSAHAPKVFSAAGFPNASPKRSFRYESDLCLSCHGSRGAQGPDPHDLSKLLVATNPSFHPVVAGGHAASVPSLLPPYNLSSRVNCTDCHANDDVSGPRGPHGSRVPKILGKGYWTTDGQAESPSAYALCYSCHDRRSILSDASFPVHKKHVVDERTSCATCHNPHGATSARALIRFNEAFPTTGVVASSSGRLEFASSSAGRGTCYLTCHGKNHDPLIYGGGALKMERRPAAANAPRGDLRPAPRQVVPAPGHPEPRPVPESPKP
jgi:predicted CXXCH cytochrome family protein